MKPNKKMIKNYDARQKAHEATMNYRSNDYVIQTRILTGGYKRPGSRKCK